ncbi:AtpZ/AtpI family protein [Guyparkeria hydrothermalis]|nr:MULTISPECIES: AtpZ/AtpI family protein [Guyparkeria]MCL7750541.1 AtpZ/AtpI family protein [Guyparkeria hydrothermalis]
MNDRDKTPADAGQKGQGGYWSARFKGLLQVGAGNMFASSIIAGLLLGYLLDAWLDTAPIFMLILGALGFVAGMRNAKKALLATGRDEPQDKDSGRP